MLESQNGSSSSISNSSNGNSSGGGTSISSSNSSLLFEDTDCLGIPKRKIKLHVLVSSVTLTLLIIVLSISLSLLFSASFSTVLKAIDIVAHDTTIDITNQLEGYFSKSTNAILFVTNSTKNFENPLLYNSSTSNRGKINMRIWKYILYVALSRFESQTGINIRMAGNGALIAGSFASVDPQTNVIKTQICETAYAKFSDAPSGAIHDTISCVINAYNESTLESLPSSHRIATIPINAQLRSSYLGSIWNSTYNTITSSSSSQERERGFFFPRILFVQQPPRADGQDPNILLYQYAHMSFDSSTNLPIANGLGNFVIPDFSVILQKTLTSASIQKGFVAFLLDSIKNNVLATSNGGRPYKLIYLNTTGGDVYENCLPFANRVMACFYNISEHEPYRLLHLALSHPLEQNWTKDPTENHHRGNIFSNKISLSPSGSGDLEDHYSVFKKELQYDVPGLQTTVYVMIPMKTYLSPVYDVRRVTIAVVIVVSLIGGCLTFFVLFVSTSSLRILTKKMEDPFNAKLKRRIERKIILEEKRKREPERELEQQEHHQEIMKNSSSTSSVTPVDEKDQQQNNNNKNNENKNDNNNTTTATTSSSKKTKSADDELLQRVFNSDIYKGSLSSSSASSSGSGSGSQKNESGDNSSSSEQNFSGSGSSSDDGETQSHQQHEGEDQNNNNNKSWFQKLLEWQPEEIEVLEEEFAALQEIVQKLRGFMNFDFAGHFAATKAAKQEQKQKQKNNKSESDNKNTKTTTTKTTTTKTTTTTEPSKTSSSATKSSSANGKYSIEEDTIDTLTGERNVSSKKQIGDAADVDEGDILDFKRGASSHNNPAAASSSSSSSPQQQDTSPEQKQEQEQQKKKKKKKGVSFDPSMPIDGGVGKEVITSKRKRLLHPKHQHLQQQGDFDSSSSAATSSPSLISALLQYPPRNTLFDYENVVCFVAVCKFPLFSLGADRFFLPHSERGNTLILDTSTFLISKLNLIALSNGATLIDFTGDHFLIVIQTRRRMMKTKVPSRFTLDLMKLSTEIENKMQEIWHEQKNFTSLVPGQASSLGEEKDIPFETKEAMKRTKPGKKALAANDRILISDEMHRRITLYAGLSFGNARLFRWPTTTTITQNSASSPLQNININNNNVEKAAPISRSISFFGQVIPEAFSLEAKGRRSMLRQEKLAQKHCICFTPCDNHMFETVRSRLLREVVFDIISKRKNNNKALLLEEEEKKKTTEQQLETVTSSSSVDEEKKKEHQQEQEQNTHFVEVNAARILNVSFGLSA